MSVLIKSIRKTDCSICVVGNRTICANGCRMVEVPPHGRLIDADALMGRIEHDTPLSSTFEKVVRRYIENAPTIIEAEDEV